MRSSHPIRNATRDTAKQRRGVAATEFAIVLPVLLLLVIACTDFGRMGHVYVAISNAARVGAEYGATHQFTDHTRDAWEDNIRAAVIEEIQQILDFDEDNLQIDLATSTDSGGSTRVQVYAMYRFETVVDWPGLPHELELQRSISMRQIR